MTVLFDIGVSLAISSLICMWLYKKFYMNPLIEACMKDFRPIEEDVGKPPKKPICDLVGVTSSLTEYSKHILSHTAIMKASVDLSRSNIEASKTLNHVRGIDFKQLKGVLDVIKVEDVKDADILEAVPLGFFPLSYAKRLIKIKHGIYGG